jgi:4-hydroxy-tetrahydrodipicolinate synthase
VIKIAVEMSRDFKAKVIAGAGTNDTKKTIKLVAEAAKWKADAALVITPYYNKPTQDGLLLHFRAVAKNSPLPLILYNVPSRTGVNMTADTAILLSKDKNIAGLKEASPDLAQFAEIARNADPDFILLSGEDSLTLPMLAVGGKGVISVAGNIVPGLMKQMLTSWDDGDQCKVLELHRKMMPLFKALFRETSPSPCKKALEMMGICSAEVRSPLSPVRPETSSILKNILLDLGLISEKCKF